MSMAVIFIFGVAVLILVYLFLPVQKIGLKRLGLGAKIRFYAKGKESGFSMAETRLLRQLAKLTNMSQPNALFWSRVQLDSCIKSLVKYLFEAHTMDTEENQIFLHKLFELRKKLEFENSRNKRGIYNSRDIEVLQPLRVVVSGAGIFKSKVVHNNRGGLILMRPDSSSLPVQFKWEGKRVVIYFSRISDATYCFESEVIEEIVEAGSSTISIKHSDNLQRSQYRMSIRAKLHRPAYLYPAETADASEMPEVISRVKCMLKDISDSGLAIIIGGNAPAGFKVIIQFYLAGVPISLSGVVTSSSFDEQNNTSCLHIRADQIPLPTKNLIMCVVLGALHDGSDIVPFNSGQIEEEHDLVFLKSDISSREKAKEPSMSVKPPSKNHRFEWDNL